MTDLGRPGHIDAVALTLWNAGLGLYGGALTGTLTGALLTLRAKLYLDLEGEPAEKGTPKARSIMDQ